jgi:hypothetical protein
MDNRLIKYFKGDFTGIFHSHDRASLPLHQFNTIEWEQLKITNIESLDYYNSWELKTSNSWYRKKLKPYSNFFLSRQWLNRWPTAVTQKKFPWIRAIRLQFPVLRKRTHLIIPLNEQYKLKENLHEVILKQITLVENGKEWFGGLREASGTIYFQVHEIIPKVMVNPAAVVAEKTIVEEKNIDDKIPITNIWSLNNETDQASQLIKQPLASKISNNKIWKWLIIGWLLLCLWKFPALFFPSLIIIGSILLYRFFRKGCLGILVAFLVFGLAFFLITNWLPKSNDDSRNTNKKDGTIKISPPKKTDQSDLVTQKQIDWWDFYKKFYSISYSTSNLSFFDSQEFHSNAVRKIPVNSNEEFYTQLYLELNSNDATKLDSLVNLFKMKITKNKLSPIRSAEMVTTFIQEIPYFLVHDFDCKTAVQNSNSKFMADYHSENKPCLPNIPAGVQSPYEFAHNLKGDCDTRSLMAYTILKKLGIPCSIWISETYGHSIVGVGLPVGAGSYKEINGVKHYATELTAKRFRLGMISPEQQNMSNWDITLFYNN